MRTITDYTRMLDSLTGQLKILTLHDDVKDSDFLLESIEHMRDNIRRFLTYKDE